MHCVVYVLRQGGKRLPADVVKGRPYVGWLHFGQDARKAFPQEAISLVAPAKPDANVIEPMIHPRLKKIERGGMLFLGSEEVRSSVTQKQAWWVIPGPLDDTTSPH